MHTRRRSSVPLAVVALGLLAGCATDDAVPGVSPDPDGSVTDDTPDPGTTPSQAPTEGSTTDPAHLPADLTIVLDESGEGETRTFDLTCEPVGGDHPDAEAACAALARAGLEGFEPTPAEVMCTEQWGGPQTATVEGSVDGRSVRASFSRTNGCEISRWDALAPLLGSSDGLL